MIYAVPGGPVAVLVGENATPGADRSRRPSASASTGRVVVQYVDWLWRALQVISACRSISRVPVLAAHRRAAPGNASTGGVRDRHRPRCWASRWRWRAHSRKAPGSTASLSGWSALALGVPTFWVGILLILLFAVELHMLPAASAYVPIWKSPWRMLQATVLPALTLGLYVSGIFARFLRGSLIAELNADYVRTARSKGLREGDHRDAPRAAQCAAAVHHHRRHHAGGLHRRRRGHRGGVHLSGIGPPRDPGDQQPRLPADPGLHPGDPRRSTSSST